MLRSTKGPYMEMGRLTRDERKETKWTRALLGMVKVRVEINRTLSWRWFMACPGPGGRNPTIDALWFIWLTRFGRRAL